ncbi:DUF421 domain-containing protein [Ornithinibacillus xuwenensis]|uniref:DUF421 domain-containing protein n=1 Tax=Ornithinibacillus xuwenensis TaxID=3144668 RepID=A0ABU9XGH5_9BACI
MEISELLLRIALSFIALFILTRIMGRKEISQMTFFNFVSAISIGTIAASLVTTANFSILYGIISLVGWTIFTLLMGYIDIKSKKARKITTGEPMIVIKNGKIIEDAMKKVRLDMDSLNSLLRTNNAFSLTEVEYAIFETSGKLSVKKKENKQALTKEDINLLTYSDKIIPLSTEVITDGTINQKNLSKLGFDRKWIDDQLKQAGIQSISDVFYAEVKSDGTLFVDKRQDFTH